ncbi:hypothetical protein RB2654_14180 [Rhodobacterales bacterium HTCC2654]|uniref:Uncharacterized protein n=1 Tax=Maritimibacter alkaliphilus HTCC2654 TaxID=314271 RepID=A3VGN5_9RHOB|nr:hypothetical protein RB2654_14180 [Rhodobacterales bacterium HTCC2654] [Maritimibacter alkaliphilus HTCC2654]
MGFLAKGDQHDGSATQTFRNAGQGP